MNRRLHHFYSLMQNGAGKQTSPLRGFPGTDTAQQVATLETMLGLIANYAPVVSRGNIVKSSTSLNSVWKVLQLYYGIQSNSDTIQLSHSKAPHQQLYKPSDQTCSIYKPPSKPDHDLQYLPENDTTLGKSVQRCNFVQSLAATSCLLMKAT